MTLATLTTAPSPEVTGGARLVSSSELAAHLAEAERAGLLAVAVPPPGPSERGQLAVVIEEAIEACLVRRGACGPGIGAAADLDGSLSDQLYRARLIELRGLALGLPPLDGIATLAGTLDAEDSAVLRWWLRATAERPVRVFLDERNRYLGVYGRPVPLHELLSQPEPPVSRSEPPPAVVPDVAHSVAAMDLAAPALVPQADRLKETEPAESASEAPREHQAEARSAVEPEPASDLVAALVAELVESHEERLKGEAYDDTEPRARDIAEASHRAPASREDDALAAALAETPAPSPATSQAPKLQAAAPVRSDVTSEPRERPSAREAVASQPQSKPTSPARTEATPARPAPSLSALPTDEAPAEADEPVLAPPLRPAHGPLNPAAAEQWESWMRDLESARGPKPLAAVERMFVTSYVPLRDALVRGIAEPRAEATLEAWATSFAQSYKEAFAALCVRGKRPTMVVDVPDMALRIARLHGARSVQLVLVDGMRFDLGLRVEQQLRALLGQEVALTERLLLWSALPSTSAAQLDLLGRGPEALKEWTGAVESEIPVARGRGASTPRRVKIGHRELLKLDLVEARLSEVGPDEASRLDALADETADALAHYISRLPARTLVMVFGDHGFLLDPIEGGTSKARQGGSRPEEVLVLAFAWLIGGLH